MSAPEGRDWAAMTPEDFDPDAPDPGTGCAVPAEPDEYGTPPLFDEEELARPSM